MPILSPKTGVLREAVLAGELRGAELLTAKRDAYLGSAPQPGKWVSETTGFVYEVVGRGPDSKRSDVVEFFVKAWTPGEKKRLVFGARKVGIERFRFVNIPVATIDRSVSGEIVGGVDTTKFVEDYQLTARDLIEMRAFIAGREDDGSGNLNEVGSTITTVYANASNGSCGRLPSSETFSTIVNGTGGTSDAASAAVSAQLTAHGSTSGRYIVNRRLRFSYDTSAIPDADPVTSAYMDLTSAGKTNDFPENPSAAFRSFTPGNPTSILNADYDNTNESGGEIADRVTYANWPSANNTHFYPTISDLTWINKTGYAHCKMKTSWDYDLTGPTWGATRNFRFDCKTSANAGTTVDPALVVTHGAAAGGSREPQPARFKNGRWHYYGRC